MKNCNQCYCYVICRIVQGVVLERFSNPGSLDELKKLWQELGLKCKYFLDKEEVASYKNKSPS